MKRFTIFAIALLALTGNALAFTNFGHQTIAALAEKYMTDKAKSEVRTILKGDMVTASTWLNTLRDEWAREFYFEGRRRIDLVRFGNFGGVHSYNWDWKGGEAGGTAFDSYFNIFPIPASEINANDKIGQNDGYGN